MQPPIRRHIPAVPPPSCIPRRAHSSTFESRIGRRAARPPELSPEPMNLRAESGTSKRSSLPLFWVADNGTESLFPSQGHGRDGKGWVNRDKPEQATIA